MDVPVRGGDQQVPARPVAFRVSPEAAARRRQRANARNQSKGRTASPGTLALCDWDVTITNVPEDPLTADEVIRLKRIRWQIEVLFKQFKSVGRLDRAEGARPARVMSELLAKLLGQVVRSWQLIASVGSPLRRSWYRWRRN